MLARPRCQNLHALTTTTNRKNARSTGPMASPSLFFLFFKLFLPLQRPRHSHGGR